MPSESRVQPLKESPISDQLNPEQQQAVSHINGPLMIIAGPGSGKTRVMTQRIANMVASGIYAPSILAITFTNKAAAEMKQRTLNLLQEQQLPYNSAPQVSTFHSFCARLLRREIHHLEGYQSDFSIYDSADQRALLSELIKERQLDRSSFSPAASQSAISRWKNDLRSPEDLINETSDHNGRQLAALYQRYQQALLERNAVDFDDLLLLTLRLLQEIESVRKYRQLEHQYLLIDEFQDTNRPQYLIAMILAAEHRNICITGDPDQSIYSWRGANPTNFLDFDENFPECQVVELTRNYRSTPQILNVAQKMSGTLRGQRHFIPQCPDGEKVIVEQHFNDQLEARRICELISMRCSRGSELGDMAVLFRVNALSRKLEEEMVRSGIPYTIVGGTAFYQRREVKDILAYIRAAANIRDSVALRRIINVPARAIGSVTLDRIEGIASEHGLILGQAIRDEVVCHPLPTRARKSVAAVREILEQIELRLKSAAIGELIAYVIEATGFEDYLRRTEPESADDRIDNLTELCNAATEAEEFYSKFSDESDRPTSALQHFLERIALVSESESLQDDEKQVVLMSMHAAKGLEFDHVFLPAMEMGLMPHERSLNEGNEDEEQRLLYVAITRARMSVTLLHASMRRRFRDNEGRVPSPYLEQLTCDDIEFRWVQQSFDSTEEYSFEDSKQSAQHWADNDAEQGSSLGASKSSDSTFAADTEIDTSSDYSDLDSYESADFDEENEFSVGIWLEHDTYGPGEIVACSGVGERRRLRVRFVDSGERNFILAYANIRILGDRPV